MENKGFLEFTENKTLKIIFLLILFIGAMLIADSNNVEQLPPDEQKLNLLGSVFLILFFPIGLLNLIPFFQGSPGAPDAGVAAIIIAPFIWPVYGYISFIYISLRRPLSYLILVVLFLLLVLNVAGCGAIQN